MNHQQGAVQKLLLLFLLLTVKCKVTSWRTPQSISKGLGKGTRNPTSACAMLGSRPDFLCQEQQPDNSLSARSQLPCRARQVREADVSQVGPVWGMPWEIRVRSRWVMSKFHTRSVPVEKHGVERPKLYLPLCSNHSVLCRKKNARSSQRNPRDGGGGGNEDTTIGLPFLPVGWTLRFTKTV